MNQKNYTIAMETRSAIYLGKGVFLVDLFLMAAYWFVMDYLRPVVHPDLRDRLFLLEYGGCFSDDPKEPGESTKANSAKPVFCSACKARERLS